jgi:hypothetical protein
MLVERRFIMNQRGPRSGVPFQVYLPAGMKELLVELSERNMRKMTAEVVIALQNHLAANGLTWQRRPAATAKGKVKK